MKVYVVINEYCFDEDLEYDSTVEKAMEIFDSEDKAKKFIEKHIKEEIEEDDAKKYRYSEGEFIKGWFIDDDDENEWLMCMHGNFYIAEWEVK